jgi:hypothetical protein
MGKPVGPRARRARDHARYTSSSHSSPATRAELR